MANKEISRWRLLLGQDSDGVLQAELSPTERSVDNALHAVYGGKGSLSPSSPSVARWLGDIRQYFPSSVVSVLQRDAIDRLNLTTLLLEPEVMQSVTPDVHLVATLLSLKSLIPSKSKETARRVVQNVVEELLRKWDAPTRQAVLGSISKSTRTRRPRHADINWHETIKKNLRHYQPQYSTIIPQDLVGYGRRRRAAKDIVLCIDQSGSMGTSVVYSAIFGAVLASLPAVRTQMVVFDTAVVDLTEDLRDPVDLLFGVQLGGGTDIHKALSYCAQSIQRPADTIAILISDLFEGGDQPKMRSVAASMVQSGVNLIVLLALNDDGSPCYDRDNAAFFSQLGCPVFACTPDKFPDLMAVALSKGDVAQWAGSNDIKLS